MKTMIAMMFVLASTGVAACGGAPGEGEASTGAAPAATTAAADAPKLEFKKVSELSASATYGVCTQAELEACERRDPGDFGSGCEIENGRVICLLE